MTLVLVGVGRNIKNAVNDDLLLESSFSNRRRLGLIAQFSFF